MSVDEDNQLHELVSQTLECNGILAKIRAELRASVFLALEDQDTFKDKPNLTNKALGDFVSTSEGALVICLVREFLQFFGLEFTLSVFDPETQLGRDYEYIERADLAKHLRIKSGKSAPLLAQVVQNACKLNNRNGCNEQSENGHPENMNKQDNRVSEDKVGTKISSLKKIASESATNEPSAVENGAINGHTKQKPTKDGVSSRLSSSEVKSMSSTGTQQTARKPEPDTLHLDLNQTNSLPNSNSSLCSLGGLPPLAPITNGPTANPLLSQKDMSNDIKAILEQSLDSQENNYEEDFHSNASERGTKKGQISASSSEIEEEEMSSAGDDQTSISAAVDEGTADTSISQESGHGDYLENV